MKDEKIIDIEKLNNSIEPAADLPRLPDGKIDIEAITIKTDEKGNRIIPDDIFDNYYKELPDKVINNSNTWRTAGGGKLKILGNSAEDKEIQIQGGKALQATLEHRRSIKEILEELSRKTVTAEEAEEYQVEEGITLLEAANLAQIRRAMKGDTKAAEYVRDTMGEKPTDKLSAEVTALTAEDKELINNISVRLAAEKNTNT
jgi:hypothetical protein